MSIEKRYYYLTSFIFILVTGTAQVHAQKQLLGFEEMWQMALGQNLEIQSALLEVERSDRLKGSAWDPGPTGFGLEHGQINSDIADNFYRIEQDLGSPFSYAANRRYYQSEKEMNLERLEKIRREVKRDLRKYYYGWLNKQQHYDVLTLSIEMFRKALEYSIIQYGSGETSLLSKTMIESGLQELIIERSRITVNQKANRNRLLTLLNTTDDIVPASETTEKLPWPGASGVAQMIADSIPEVSLEYRKLRVTQTWLGVTRAELSPSLKAGYFNQEINNIRGFQGWTLGFAIPIWFFPQKSRIQAAAIGTSIAENNYIYQKTRMENEFKSKVMVLDQLTENLQYYEDQQLQLAVLIEENANMLYTSGEIGYLEYVQNMSRSLQMRRDYLDLLGEYNQLIIELYYYVDL